jgi:transposase
MSLAPALVLRGGDRERLGDLARLPSVPSGLAKRARMVLLAADGVANAQIARTAGVSRPTVIGWRDRYAHGGIAALADEPRSGRRAVADEIGVVVATLVNEGRPPERLGISHWSARFLAAELDISFASVARIWRKWDIQPHRIEGFKFSIDPGLIVRPCQALWAAWLPGWRSAAGELGFLASFPVSGVRRAAVSGRLIPARVAGRLRRSGGGRGRLW